MKRRTQLIAMLTSIVLATGLFAGCGSGGAAGSTAAGSSAAASSAGTSAAGSTASGDTHVVKDANDREVTVPNNPKAIAVGVSVMPHMIYALQGRGDNMVAMTKPAFTGYKDSIMYAMSPEIEKAVDTTSMGDKINMEALMKLHPDMAFIWQGEEDKAEQLESMGVPTVILKSAKNWDELKSLITMAGDALNCQDNAKKLCAMIDDTQSFVASKKDEISKLSDNDKPKTLHFQYVEQLQIYGKGINPGIAESVGGRNIKLTGSSADTNKPTMEEILEYNPDIIFISNFDDYTPEDFYNNKIKGQDWSQVNAVKNHQVYKVPKGLYRWAPPNSIEKPLYVKWMAKIVQPEIFKDIDMDKEVKDFFKSYFNYDIKDDQLTQILHKDMNK